MVGLCVQALSAAEQGEKDPLGRTSSTISLQLIMQSEAAGLFNTPGSGKDGHAILAASIAKAHEAGQEAAIREHAESAGSSEHGMSHDQSVESQGLATGQSGLPLPGVNSKRPPSKSQSWDHGRPGPLGFSAHDAPVQMTGMHSGELTSMTQDNSGELTLASSPILMSRHEQHN